jgi:thermopsin
MRSYSRLALPLLFVLALSFLPALAHSEQIGTGYYTWQQINVTGPSTIAVAYNTTRTAELIVMTAAQYGSFVNGSSYQTLYDQNAFGSQIITLNVGGGSYYAVLNAKYSAVNADVGITAAPVGQGRMISVSGSYNYTLNLNNYSRVNASWIATGPFNITAGYNYPISSYNASEGYQDLWYQNRGSNINITSQSPIQIFMYMNITPSLINPFDQNFSNFSNPQPIGISSFGLENISGQIVPYQIITDRIDGKANITSINAYNASPPANVSRYGASLQLNVNLQVVADSGVTYSYWLQNVMDIDTHNQTYYLVDNIWNYSAPNANVTNNTLSGEGSAFLSSYNGTGTLINTSIYGYSTNYTYYRLPLYFYPIIKITNSSGFPVVSFGFINSSGEEYYDNVTLNIPAKDAYLIVTPYYETNSPNFYDSEFVFGGASDGEITQFSRTNAYLQMFYDNNGTMTEFPSLYTFGYDTSEAAQGLRTLQSGNLERVVNGTPNFYNIIYPPSQSLGGSLNLPISPPSSTTIVQNSTASTQGQTLGNGVPSYLPIAIAAVLVVIAAACLYRVMGKGRRQNAPPLGT